MSFQKIKSSTSRCFDISTAALHIIAMLFMLMDHLWATLLPAQEWLTCVGRIAFPIFAFMSVEGYFHTHNFKKYLLRMLVFAVISEIPFDLMYGGTWFYPVHQNVIWTFVLGLLGIHIMETVRKKKKTPVFVLTAILVTIAGGLLGTLTMVDYYGIGVLTVFIFYFSIFFRTGVSWLKPVYFSAVRCQISLLYSSIVLSEEKYPAFPYVSQAFFLPMRFCPHNRTVPDLSPSHNPRSQEES